MCFLITEHCSKVNGEDKAGSGSMVENMESEDIHNNMDALPSQSTVSETASPRMSWADMTQEDGLEDEEQKDVDVSHSIGDSMKTPEKPKLPREERERIRFMNVKKMKVFSCFERVKGKDINILEGLELHTGVFSAVEQKKIVDLVYELQDKGRKGELQGSLQCFLSLFLHFLDLKTLT